MAETSVAPFGSGLFLATRPKQWRKLRARFEALDVDVPAGLGHTQLLSTTSGHSALIVYIDPRRASCKAGLVDTVAHEAAHVARFILDHVGETHATHEVEPYMVGWVAGWLWQHL